MIPSDEPGAASDRRPGRPRTVVIVAIIGLVAGGSLAGVATAAIVGTGTAQLSSPVAEVCGESAEPLVTSYNTQIVEVPWFVRFAVRGKVVHGVVHDDAIGNFTVETGADGTIQSLEAGVPDAPGVRVITTCDSFLRIQEAGDPIGVFWTEYRNDRVRIVGIGFANWLLFAMLRHPVAAAGLSLIGLLAIGLGYYYVRRRQLMRNRGVPGDAGDE